jgi:Fe-S oxidoreductase/nitrate reductase gamma subunit
MTAKTVPVQPQGPRSLHIDKLAQAWQRLRPRLRDFFLHVIGQARILSKAYPGVMHLLIFWGVTIQVLGTAINLMQMELFVPFALTIPRGNAYLIYELLMDLAGLAILVGVLMALFRRLVLRPKTLQTRWDDIYVLIMLGLIPMVGFTIEGLRLLVAQPAWSAWSPVGNLVARLMGSLGLNEETATRLHLYIFWTHMFLALALVASIPFTKLRHLFATPLHVILRPLRKDGVLEKIENIEEAEKLGVGKIEEFASQQLLSFDACVRCGRCEESCPATNSGQAYSPRTFIQTLRQAMVDNLINPNGNKGVSLEALPEDTIWSCTTCGACLKRCPAFVNPVDEIIALRRYQALTSGKLPKSAAETLRNLERRGNPWGIAAEERIAWTQDLGIRELAPGDETDVLLFTGCAFAYDERNKKVTRSFASLLQKAGIDFAILGLDEMCCGETARRLGHEYLFQEFARQNIEVLNQVKFKQIVTQCPHCFNTLKNEYPQLGGGFPIQHYTEFLAGLAVPWEEISPNGQSIKGQVAYHDSCYLGRYNQIYNQPRNLLKQSQVSLVELPRAGQDSFCCGGGGGQMWLESDANTRINRQRLKDVLAVHADVIATACPYCLLMFDDAIRSQNISGQVQVFDIAEIMERQFSQ